METTQSSADLKAFIAILPPRIVTYLDHLFGETEASIALLQEIVLDLGASPEIRFENTLSKRLTELGLITQTDIDTVVSALGTFNSDNRAGLAGTLHRISAIRNRVGTIIGLTCRVGRAIYGTIEVVRDLIESKKNILFLGPPGSGKTTKLRESARVLANQAQRRVLIVDTSNEIAGDGDVPHPGIGWARRMQVPSPDKQHAVMIEAVENHMPQVIIVDEIGTTEETQAARTIAERGVQLIATAHGYTLENIIKNPTLSDLVGGIQSVILGDDEAKIRGTQKTILERKAMPTFDIIVELRDREILAVYHDTKQAVDGLLRGERVIPSLRKSGQSYAPIPETHPAPIPETSTEATPPAYSIFPYGITYDRVHRVISALNAPLRVARHVSDADFVLTLRRQVQLGKIAQILKDRDIPIHVLKKNSAHDIEIFIRNLCHIAESDVSPETEALDEIRDIITRVKSERRVIEATPRPSYLRRLQHQEVSTLGFHSISIGEDPMRRLRIYPRQ